MKIDYFELAALVDRMLEIAGNSVERLAEVLETLDEEVRREILVSDLLNALQVFYYFFREMPSELVQERLMLAPASELERGVPFEDVDICQLVFLVKDGEPHVLVTDSASILASFRGRNAYREAFAFLEEHPC